MIANVVKNVKKVIGVCLGLVLLLACVNYEIILYGLRQGKGQLKILLNAKPVEEVLSDDSFPDSLKVKINLVQDIRRFAIDSLGLKDSDNYTTIYDQKGKDILWVVNACPPFSLEEHKWSYPLLGDLGYKGFFEKELAIEEEARMKDEGYDTDIGTVNGWSTLGWFKDPILSNMLYRSEGRLADLIIHELTHATVYVKGDAKFNENLATFIGNYGAIEFLRYRYGKNSNELLNYRARLIDRKKYAEHLNRGARKLENLYASFGNGMSNEDKLKAKEKQIKEIFNSSDTINFVNKERFRFLNRFEDQLPNNTYFTSYKMYHDEQSSIKEDFEKNFDKDFKKYLNYIKEKYGKNAVN